MEEKTFDEVFFQEDSVEVKVGDETFKVMTLVRKQYTAIIQLAATLTFNLNEDILDNLEENIGVIAQLVSDELLLEIYEAVLEKDKEWINNNMRLSQEVKLLTAIFKTNDIKELVENFTQALNLISMVVQKKSQK